MSSKFAPTLLEKAKATKQPCKSWPDGELLELALAYARSEINGYQIASALGWASHEGCHARMASVVLTGIRRGALRVERVKP